MAVAIAIVAVAALVIGVVVASQMKPPGGQDMSPATLDSFQITRAQEGHCVPFITGTVRQTGNILWYGNLATTKVTQDVGGKAGGSESVTIGYKYYLDLWQAVCLGSAEIISLYVNDKPKELSDLGTYEQNNGYDDTSYPTQPGEYANKLRGVCHIFLNQYYLGENVSAVPTLHWVVKSTSLAPLTNANMPGGTNAAAVIYDLLCFGGAVLEDFNLTSFQAAADYFYAKGYALNMAFTTQKEVREHINDVLNYIDAGFDIDAEGKFTLTPFDADDVSQFTLEKDDFIKFQFTRRAWKDTFNDFRANYTDAEQAYTTRTLRTKNPANRRMVGYMRQKTVDLTAFTDPVVVSKRLWEIMQRMSYPESQITVAIPFKYASYPVGTVFTVNHEDYGISNFQFRIVTKDIGEVDSQEVKIVGAQMVEKLADANYESPGGSQWITPDYSPDPFVKRAVFELPYNSQSGNSKVFLLLGAREGVETSFLVLVSTTGTDYATIQTSTTFSQHGIINEEYPNIDTTMAIDDEVGILYTPYREDPIYDSLSRTDLFAVPRIAIIGTEIMTFQTVTPVGANQIRLTGIIRGLFNTTPVSHNVNSEIWLTKISDNLLTNISASFFYTKLLPSNGENTVDPSLAGAVLTNVIGKAAIPWNITGIIATRSGATVDFIIHPSSQYFDGAGKRDNADQNDVEIFNFAGEINFTTNRSGHDTVLSECIHQITEAQSLTAYVSQTIDGKTGAVAAINVGSADGIYYGPEGKY